MELAFDLVTSLALCGAVWGGGYYIRGIENRLEKLEELEANRE